MIESRHESQSFYFHRGIIFHRGIRVGIGIYDRRFYEKTGVSKTPAKATKKKATELRPSSQGQL